MAREIIYWGRPRLFVPQFAHWQWFPLKAVARATIAEAFDELTLASLRLDLRRNLFSHHRRGRTQNHLFRANPSTGAFDRVSSPDNLQFGSPSFNADNSRIAFTCAWPNVYPEICVSPIAQFSAQPVTNMKDQLKGFKLATRELIEWKSKDGASIEGILIKPADFDATKKYPLLVVSSPNQADQGADHPCVTGDRTYPIEMFAAKAR